MQMSNKRNDMIDFNVCVKEQNAKLKWMHELLRVSFRATFSHEHCECQSRQRKKSYQGKIITASDEKHHDNYLRVNQNVHLVIDDRVQAFFLQVLYCVFAVIVIAPAEEYQAEVLGKVHLTDVAQQVFSVCDDAEQLGKEIWRFERKFRVF